MHGSWQKVVDSVLRPRRPQLERCLAERAAKRVDEKRARAIKDCERRIELARAAVFAANDGVIPASMTDLEREWRRLTRPDPEAGLMDLWARIAPPSWIDRKRWRDAEPHLWVDAAIALAADVEGVEAAESAIGALRIGLAAWGIAVGPHVRWHLAEQDSAHGSRLFAAPLRFARQAAPMSVLEHAEALEREVHAAMLTRFPERPLLARDISHAAFIDSLWHGAELARQNPVAPLRDLWSAGYALAAIDERGVTLEIPPL